MSIGCDTKSDADLMALGELTEEAKAKLDELHLCKIDLADEILVVNVDDYIGESTTREIAYARAAGKRVRWLTASQHALPGEEGATPTQGDQPQVGGSLTTDRSDPRLHQVKPDGQNEAYLVLSEEERAKGFVRPVRRSYVHQKAGCGTMTTMGLALAETYARDPKFYSHTFCAGCRTHLPVEEFVWDGTIEKVGS